ncbi:MAG: hypothetical protein WDO19_09910 [Bacteroidota bacterium]
MGRPRDAIKAAPHLYVLFFHTSLFLSHKMKRWKSVYARGLDRVIFNIKNLLQATPGGTSYNPNCPHPYIPLFTIVQVAFHLFPE